MIHIYKMMPSIAYKSTSSEFEDLLRGKYELVEKIGKGSYGDVYRALDVQHHRYVAIKRMRHHADGSLRCALEPVVMRSIFHPYLLHAEEVLAGATILCVVMPLALDDAGAYLRKHPTTPLHQRLQWCWQICQALACLHQSGVIHGDLKEENCLVMPDHRCVLADFTLSVLCPKGHTHSHMVYTFTHRPPELFMHKAWSYASDAWALGCTLYELVYQKTLFPYQNEGRVLDDERPLYTKALACFRAFGLETQQNDTTLNIALLGKRPGKWVQPRIVMKEGIEYAGINDLILRLLRINPSERLTLPDVLAHPLWTEGAYPIHGLRYGSKPQKANTAWDNRFTLLPPPAEPWLTHLTAWAETWTQAPPPVATHWVWASLCVLMRMMHLTLYCAPPDELKEVQKTEKTVLEAAGWSIPWKIWWDGVPTGFGVRAASPRPQSPPHPESPPIQGQPIPLHENVAQST